MAAMGRICRAHLQLNEGNQEWEISAPSEQYRAAPGSSTVTSNRDEWLASPKGPERFCHSCVAAPGWAFYVVQLQLLPQPDVSSPKEPDLQLSGREGKKKWERCSDLPCDITHALLLLI